MASRVILPCNAPLQNQDAGFHTIFCPGKLSRYLIATLPDFLLQTQAQWQNLFPALSQHLEQRADLPRPIRYCMVSGSFINISIHHEDL